MNLKMSQIGKKNSTIIIKYVKALLFGFAANKVLNENQCSNHFFCSIHWQSARYTDT